MNKVGFMWKLQSALRWAFGKDEIEDILSDYEGFFEEGKKEGKSEAEICADLGKPVDIARNLAETLDKKRRLPLSARIIMRIAMGGLLLLVGFVYYASLYYRVFGFLDSVLVFVGATMVLWFVLGGTFRAAPPIPRSTLISNTWDIWGGHLFFAAAAVTWFFIVRHWMAMPFESEEIFAFANTAMRMRTVFVAAALLIGVLSIYGFYRRSLQYFTVVAHTIAIVAYFSMWLMLLWSLDDPAHFQSTMRMINVIYGVSLVWTALLGVFIHKTSGGKRGAA